MSNTLNYTFNFKSNADRITAGVDRLEDMLDATGKSATSMGNKFNQAMDSMNKKLSVISLDAFINNVEHAAQGLNSLSEPGLKLDAQLQDLSAITGVVGDDLKEIEGYARKSAKTFGGEAAAGIESYKLILSQLSPEIAKQPKALQAMGNSVSILSKTMGGDTVAATEVLTTAMNQYQISTQDPIKASKEMTDMMNIMAAAAKEGSAELPQQKQALEQSGMAAKTAKVSFAETAAAIQVLDKAGKKGSEGGVALRNTLATLSQGRFLPKDVQEELRSAGVDVNVLGDKSLSLADRMRPLKGIMNDTALITKLFGKENSNAAIAMIAGIEEQERLTKAIQGTNTAQEQAATVMESQAEKNSRLKARVDDFKISMFNATGGAIGYASVLGDVARDTANLMPIFVGATNAVSWLSKAKNRDMIITAAKAAWDGIAAAATSVWTGAQWALNAAMNANPIGLIIAGVVALGAGIAWIVSKTEGWGAAWQHTINGAKFLFQSFVLAGKAYFDTMVNGFMIGINLIKTGWYEFKEVMGLGDSSENQRMIEQINADTEKRKKAITDGAKKAAEYAIKANNEFAKAAGSISWKTDEEAEKSGSKSNGFGITPPAVPGTNNDSTAPGGDKKDKSQTNTAIATGGTKHNYITIHLKSLIENLDIKGSDFKESAKQMETQSADALLRVLALTTTAGD